MEGRQGRRNEGVRRNRQRNEENVGWEVCVCVCVCMHVCVCVHVCVRATRRPSPLRCMGVGACEGDMGWEGRKTEGGRDGGTERKRGREGRKKQEREGEGSEEENERAKEGAREKGARE